MALFDLASEVNAIYPTFAKESSLPIRTIDVRAEKIDSTMLDNYKMIVAAFLVIDKENQVRFFKEIFLVTNFSLQIVFIMLFLILGDANTDFLDWKLW